MGWGRVPLYFGRENKGDCCSLIFGGVDGEFCLFSVKEMKSFCDIWDSDRTGQISTGR